MKSAVPRKRTLRAALLLSLLPFTASCASNAALRGALKDRNTELAREREQHAETNRRLQEALRQQEELQGKLSERPKAVAQTLPASAPAQNAFPELDSLGVEYGTRDGNLVITLPAAITFGAGKATLTKEGQTALRAVANRLEREYPNTHLFVEGHTDSDPINKSSFASNRELSIARAMSVLSYLVETCHIPDERFIIVGNGQYHPIAGNDNPQGKARNRRVEIVVHRDK